MRKAIPFLATVLSSLLVASVAHAQSKPSQGATKQTYKWTDDKGVDALRRQRPVRVFAA